MDKYSQKDTFTFPHDRNAMADHKMIDLNEKLGCEGSGIFWILIEALSREPTYRLPLSSLPGTARHFNSTFEKFKAVVIGFKLFKNDKEYFWSESLIRRMAEREDFHINMTKLAYKRYKKEPPPDRLINKARALLTQYGGNAYAERTDQLRTAIREDKLSKAKLSKDKLREEAVLGGMGGITPLMEQYQDSISPLAAAIFTDSFRLFYESTKKDYQDLDYETELKKFFQFWNEGKKTLKRPNQAWLNWLSKAREIKNRDNHKAKELPPAANPLADLQAKYEREKAADNG